GRQLGFAALAVLESLPPPGTHYLYAGPVVSGATIGTWQHAPVAVHRAERQATWSVLSSCVNLDYRADLPTLEQSLEERSVWQGKEAQATAAGRADEARDCLAQIERAERQLWKLRGLPAGCFPLPTTVARLGNA